MRHYMIFILEDIRLKNIIASNKIKSDFVEK